jgi:hypothetical protein
MCAESGVIFVGYVSRYLWSVRSFANYLTRFASSYFTPLLPLSITIWLQPLNVRGQLDSAHEAVISLHPSAAALYKRMRTAIRSSLSPINFNARLQPSLVQSMVYHSITKVPNDLVLDPLVHSLLLINAGSKTLSKNTLSGRTKRSRVYTAFHGVSRLCDECSSHLVSKVACEEAPSFDKRDSC